MAAISIHFLEEEMPRDRLALLLKHFSQVEDDREPWRVTPSAIPRWLMPFWTVWFTTLTAWLSQARACESAAPSKSLLTEPLRNEPFAAVGQLCPRPGMRAHDAVE